MRQKDLRPAPALIEFKGMKFLITDRPSDVTIHHYILELKKNNVNTVVRVCEPSYNTEELETQGIIVKDLAFEDGTFPPQQVVDEWFEILKQNFRNSNDPTVAFIKNKRFSLKHKPKTATTTTTASTAITATSNTTTRTTINNNINNNKCGTTISSITTATTNANSNIDDNDNSTCR
ncbi:protein tyrosine phosphatase type IVA 2 isoform X1 [Teleopsis dalmanni]|uniref:protein tyrosine phosphatase type IVA 2 isoform X1 n=1 Tax=Teleopsis dalmanni TaxID=139649 RepID=UPI0018CDF11F|nr:protein tyrosine phosphatase type IVA 2 isoform X1 [Teleopsis dalmanni]